MTPLPGVPDFADVPLGDAPPADPERWRQAVTEHARSESQAAALAAEAARAQQTAAVLDAATEETT